MFLKEQKYQNALEESNQQTRKGKRPTHKEIINHISYKLQNIKISIGRRDLTLKAAQALTRYPNVFIEISKEDVCIGSSKNWFIPVDSDCDKRQLGQKIQLKLKSH